MLSAIKNTTLSILDPKKTNVIAKKILYRLRHNEGSLCKDKNKAWLKDRGIADQEWLSAQEKELWDLAQQKQKDYVATDVARIKGTYPQQIHGPGGAYAMLYFLIRKYQPEYVVETGVSLGCSSHAILTAMEENNKGELHSSDFPYFRIKDAEKYVGLVVPERLKSRWHLYLAGDEKNLQEIYTKIPHIDFFHYDSDKSFAGRQMAYDITVPKMAAGSLMLFDDLQDNAHFHDLIKTHNLEDRSKIIEYHGKYIGVVDGF